MIRQVQVPLRIVLLKPSKYAADGYIERFRRGFMPNSTVAFLKSLSKAAALLGYSGFMTKLETAERLLSEMNRAEKAQILQWVVQDLGDAFPGIESRPDVCGGEPCIVRTRIPVWLLVQGRRLGTSEADLLRAYPTLRAENLANAWAYSRAHPSDIERQIRDNEAA